MHDLRQEVIVTFLLLQGTPRLIDFGTYLRACSWYFEDISKANEFTNDVHLVFSGPSTNILSP